MTPRQEALEHLIWAASSGITSTDVCASLGFDLPHATSEQALHCLEVVALEMRDRPRLVAVK